MVISNYLRFRYKDLSMKILAASLSDRHSSSFSAFYHENLLHEIGDLDSGIAGSRMPLALT